MRGLLCCCITWALSMIPFVFCFFKWARLFFFFLIFISVFLTAMDLHCCAWAFSSCGKWELSSSCSVQASHCGDFSSRRAWALKVHRLSCPMACGILPDQGWNPCPLHWQVDSKPPDHQKSSVMLTEALFSTNQGLWYLVKSRVLPLILLVFHVFDLNAWVNSLFR